jgi:hypothetical protein
MIFLNHCRSGRFIAYGFFPSSKGLPQSDFASSAKEGENRPAFIVELA